MTSPESMERYPPPLVSFDPEREELEAVLSSGLFDRNSNLGRLLTYVCERRFDGSSDQLKEYNIAVDVFGRGPDFDKRRDSIVRVEASRLRRKLQEFYAGAGAGHAIQIVLPPGCYVPRFVPRESSAEPGEPDVPSRLRAGRMWWVAAAGVLLAIVGAYLITRAKAGSQEGGKSPSSRGINSAADTAGPEGDIRILAGYDKPRYVDRAGRVWTGDRFFTGGFGKPTGRNFIFRTIDPTPYLNCRTGGEIRYRIPLRSGPYEMRLHFAETEFGPGQLAGGAEGSRVVHVGMNGRTLVNVDVLALAGAPNTSSVLVFRDVRPAETGYLDLEFTTMSGQPFINAIELLPYDPDRPRPIRIVARESSYTDRAGRVWEPDNYFWGGRLVTRSQTASGTEDPDFYQGERYGHFNYDIPVAGNRKYTVRLRFAETWFCGTPECGGGEGKRKFNVYCNGIRVLKDFDIFKEAGGAFRPADQVLRHVEPNSLGRIHLSFEPVRSYACLNGIEVSDESDWQRE